MVTEAEIDDGGGFFLDCPKALAGLLVEKLNFYKLRAKIVIEDLSPALGVMAFWDGAALSEDGLSFPDPRLPAMGTRSILPPQLAADAAAALGATIVEADAYEAHRIALGVPRGGMDFAYLDTFPHEADMDQLEGVDFDKGCYVGQEVVSRVEHRASARSRIVPVAFEEFVASSGLAVMAGDKQVGTLGTAANGRGLAMLRLDRAADAITGGTALTCGNLTIRLVKPTWATFPWPGEANEGKTS
jgi:hypothetical protein